MELKKIAVCQGGRCSLKGSEHYKKSIEELWREKYQAQFPALQIVATGCNGGCDQGIIVLVNETVVGKRADRKFIEALFADPAGMVNQIITAERDDKATLQRIIAGELY